MLTAEVSTDIQTAFILKGETAKPIVVKMEVDSIDHQQQNFQGTLEREQEVERVNCSLVLIC